MTVGVGASGPGEEELEACVKVYRENRRRITLFMNAVCDFFLIGEQATSTKSPIHSVKSRLKDEDHLREKIIRKNLEEPNSVRADNLLETVTDLAGVRVLHLYQQQFSRIAESIAEHVSAGEWALFEPPKAYTWDPEAEPFFAALGLSVERKESFYTSVHYVVKPRADSPITCEIQVRTLFEEAWGEIDHLLNYPTKTASLACREQIRVLSKLVGAGTRLADAIFRTNEEWKTQIFDDPERSGST